AGGPSAASVTMTRRPSISAGGADCTAPAASSHRIVTKPKPRDLPVACTACVRVRARARERGAARGGAECAHASARTRACTHLVADDGALLPLAVLFKYAQQRLGRRLPRQAAHDEAALVAGRGVADAAVVAAGAAARCAAAAATAAAT